MEVVVHYNDVGCTWVVSDGPRDWGAGSIKSASL